MDKQRFTIYSISSVFLSASTAEKWFQNPLAIYRDLEVASSGLQKGTKWVNIRTCSTSVFYIFHNVTITFT